MICILKAMDPGSAALISELREAYNELKAQHVHAEWEAAEAIQAAEESAARRIQATEESAAEIMPACLFTCWPAYLPAHISYITYTCLHTHTHTHTLSHTHTTMSPWCVAHGQAMHVA